MIEEMRELYAYTRWANARVLDAVARLDHDAFTRSLGSSFPSVRETLVHTLGADWIWLERWRGHSPSGHPASWDQSTFPALRAAWAQVEDERDAFLAGLTDADLEREISYRNTAGQPFSSSFARMLRHVVNHSTYHRGQVVGMLRQLGAEGVGTDLILWYREQAPRGAPATG
jgi:uncharacterized damage-inducible protein DinB